MPGWVAGRSESDVADGPGRADEKEDEYDTGEAANNLKEMYKKCHPKFPVFPGRRR